MKVVEELISYFISKKSLNIKQQYYLHKKGFYYNSSLDDLYDDIVMDDEFEKYYSESDYYNAYENEAYNRNNDDCDNEKNDDNDSNNNVIDEYEDYDDNCCDGIYNNYPESHIDEEYEDYSDKYYKNIKNKK